MTLLCSTAVANGERAWNVIRSALIGTILNPILKLVLLIPFPGLLLAIHTHAPQWWSRFSIIIERYVALGGWMKEFIRICSILMQGVNLLP